MNIRWLIRWYIFRDYFSPRYFPFEPAFYTTNKRIRCVIISRDFAYSMLDLFPLIVTKHVRVNHPPAKIMTVHAAK